MKVSAGTGIEKDFIIKNWLYKQTGSDYEDYLGNKWKSVSEGGGNTTQLEKVENEKKFQSYSKSFETGKICPPENPNCSDDQKINRIIVMVIIKIIIIINSNVIIIVNNLIINIIY